LRRERSLRPTSSVTLVGVVSSSSWLLFIWFSL
jgi:hypothetical protein